MFEKVWNDHVVVAETADTPAVLFIDLHLTHEVTTPQAYTELRKRGPITAKLQAAYFGLVQGKTQDKWGWLDYVDMNAPRAAVAG